MVHAIQFHQQGGAEVLQWKAITLAAPRAGEVLLRHTAIGLNYIDIYHRNGVYPVPHLPTIPGLEAAGIVEALGPDVTDLTIGDRVAYAAPPLGAYAEQRLMPADRLVKLPDTIDDKTAAAMMLQGMTVHYLIHRTYQVKPGDTVLFHAAAGGVGLIACRWLAHLGVTIIGTVGSEEKAELARANGCHHTILYKQEDIAKRVRELTQGKGVPVVYDSVGRDTWEASLDSLAPLGLMVSFGNASGPIDAINPGVLAQKGSLFFTRPSLMTYTADRADLLRAAQDLIHQVQTGVIKIDIRQTWPLSEAAKAHQALENRQTTGSSILTV